MEGSVRPDRISIGPDCVDCVEGGASMNGRSEVGTRVLAFVQLSVWC